MGDVGDDYRAWDKAKKEQKRANLVQSTALIMAQGFNRVETKNGGTHLVIHHNNEIADFWPSTGKYKIRFKGGYKRGVKRLIKELNSSQ